MWGGGDRYGERANPGAGDQGGAVVDAGGGAGGCRGV